MQRAIDNLEFVQGVNFIFKDSSQNNSTKYMLISDDSCEDTCNSKAFFVIATAQTHRGLSNF